MKNIDLVSIKHALYLNKETVKEERTIENRLGTATYRLEEFWDYNDILCGYDSLIVQPQYWDNKFIDFIIEKNIKCLYLEDRIIGGFFEKEPDKFKTLESLSFLKQISHLKCFKMDAYTSFFHEKPVIKIDDYTPLENLSELEYVYIPDNGEFPIFVDIDFSKLSQLKEVNLQYPQENKTIYQCEHLETVNTRYYEKSLDAIKNWKKLRSFSAYCDNLESFEGLDRFDKLQTFTPEVTSHFQSFHGIHSQSIKTFYVYTEAKKTPKTLEGISGLEVVEDIALNGFKQLESIGDLHQCHSLKKLTFENCKIPSDISKISSLTNVEKLIFDDCKEMESLEFVTKLPNLKYLSFDGNTKIIDGNLKFLKKLHNNGTEIYFNDRKHYSIKYKDLDR